MNTIKVLVKRPTIGEAFASMNEIQRHAAHVAIGYALTVGMFAVGLTIVSFLIIG